MKDITAVVFDMDGVIFDSENKVMECWVETAEKYGIKDIEKLCRMCLGTNSAETRRIALEFYGEDFPYDEYKKEMSDLYHSRYDNGRLPMKEGVRELLEFLKQNGIKIALASSTRRTVVHHQLEHAEILPYFDKVVCGDMVERSKPAPDIFLKACEELSVSPADAVAIEDSYNGIRSAHSAGMRPIMVPDLAPPTEEMQQLTETILPSLLDVIRYIGKD
ncbi:MAG: HAD family phosphatase [Oscillospiraceae bacterium]|nr:HAD family phosphatase [Oscillospiraceae bacterium]